MVKEPIEDLISNYREEIANLLSKTKESCSKGETSKLCEILCVLYMMLVEIGDIKERLNKLEGDC